MLPKLLDINQLVPGMSPDLVYTAGHLWETAQNVVFTDEGFEPGWKHELAVSNTEVPVRGMHGQRTASLAQILFVGTLTKLLRSVALGNFTDVSNGVYTTPADASTGSLAGIWQFENWGEWVLATNGTEQIQIYKTGPTFTALTQTAGVMPFTFAKCIAKVGPFVLAFNTNNAPNEVYWCSLDDVHDWIPTANNSAGEFIIRDLESEIVAVVRLGENVAILANDSMHIGSFIGAPNYFGFRKVLSGVGAVGRASVTVVGRLLYGLGMQGFYITDGTQVTYIDQPQMRKRFWSKVVRAQVSKTVCYHNEDLNRVEWFYPTGASTHEGIAYDYRLKAWSEISGNYTFGLEREVFTFPLLALSTGAVHAIGSGANDTATLTSKPLDFGSQQHGKFVSHVYLQHTGTVVVEIGYHDNLNDAVTWLAAQTLAGTNDPFRVGVTARYFRIRISGTSAFRIGGIEFYGRGGGAHK